MRLKHRLLLATDAFVNLLLGILLLLAPTGVLEWLGLPDADTYFYATILGAVIFGIGIALLIELWGTRHGFRGLGQAGAVAINFCGAGILIVWLLVGTDLPLRGRIVLWIVALAVLGLGSAELAVPSRKYHD